MRVLVLLVAACTQSASMRTVVTTQPQLEEAEPAAQPARGSAAAPVEPAPTTPPGTGTTTPANEPMVFGMLDGELALEDAWDRWNAGKTTTYEQVFDIAVLANRARPLPMSDELMVIALAKAVEMSGCDPERLGRIRLLAIAVNTSPHVKELDAELERLADTGPVECERLAK